MPLPVLRRNLFGYGMLRQFSVFPTAFLELNLECIIWGLPSHWPKILAHFSTSIMWSRDVKGSSSQLKWFDQTGDSMLFQKVVSSPWRLPLRIQKVKIHAKKSYGVNWRTYGVNSRNYCFSWVSNVLKSNVWRVLALGWVKRSYSPMYHGHRLGNGSHWRLGPQTYIKHSDKMQRDSTQIGKWWFTRNPIDGIFVEPRHLFFMTAFSRSDGNKKQPQRHISATRWI